MMNSHTTEIRRIDATHTLGKAMCLASLALGLVTASARAETLYVPGQYATIQAAIDAASDGDVIAIAAGTYLLEETDDFRVENFSISIIGETNADGSPAVTIDGQLTGAASFQIIDAGKEQATIENLRIVNCLGGLAFNNSAASVSNCIIENNWGYYGPVIFVNAQVTLNDCAIVGNQGVLAGGLSVWGDNVTLVDCVIEGNTGSHSFSGMGGIAIHNGTTTLNGCTIRNNSGSAITGLYIASEATTALADTTICGNQGIGNAIVPQIYGDWTDNGGNTIAETCLGECPGDLNGDGEVNGLDLGIFFVSWGSCAECRADFNGDGEVNGLDLGIFFVAWGICQ